VFLWERGLLGPAPVKIDADLRRYQSGLTDRPDRALCSPQPLTDIQARMSLADLAVVFAHLKPTEPL
jgi:hypothetical protein